MKFTVFGSSGFIGKSLARALAETGHECATPARDAPLQRGSLGNVVYCVGVTADFRTRPYETARAHVGVLADLLELGGFDSLLYLSSTRVYGNAAATLEDAPLVVRPSDPNDLYNLTKLAGESLCLAINHPGVRVARLSNVFGGKGDSPNFLDMLIREAADRGVVHLRTSRESVKDYVAIEDVVRLLPQIALNATQRLYNVASGHNVSHGEVVDALAAATGCTVSQAENAPTVIFPRVEVNRLQREFGGAHLGLVESIPNLVQAYLSK